jgi:hypothetical protein
MGKVSNSGQDTKMGLTVPKSMECNIEGAYLQVDTHFLAGGGADAGTLCNEIDSIYI